MCYYDAEIMLIRSEDVEDRIHNERKDRQRERDRQTDTEYRTTNEVWSGTDGEKKTKTE